MVIFLFTIFCLKPTYIYIIFESVLFYIENKTINFVAKKKRDLLKQVDLQQTRRI